MQNLRKDLELIEVVHSNENKKATMTFLDVENGEVLEVNFNKQSYDNGKFVDDPEKAKKVDEWCEEYFGTTFSKLSDSVGVKKDVYRYEKFNSLWETKVTQKFSMEDKGKIIQTEISRIEDDGKGIHIYFEHGGKEYASKMMYADYVETVKEWFTNPQKKTRQYEKFEGLFGVPVEDAESIVGKPIMVEVQIAFKKYPYAEVKVPAWR